MIKLSRTNLDLGMVAYNTDEMLTFYRDVLALPSDGSITMKGLGVLHKFLVGTNLVKVFVPEETPTPPPGGGMPGLHAGARYWTAHVTNLDEILAALAKHGVLPVTGPNAAGPVIRWAIINDPDGNGIEFVEGS